MLLQLLAVQEGELHLLHDVGLFLGQHIGLGAIDGWEEGVEQRMFDTADIEHAPRIIDLIEQQAVFHQILRPPLDELALELELDDGDRLLHLRHQADFIAGEIFARVHLGAEQAARIVLVGFHGERGQRQEADPVTVAQRFHVAVAQRAAHHVGDAGLAPGGRAHPQDVVVAPLDVDLMMLHQVVKNEVRPRPTVVNVTDDVQLLDGQALDQFGQAGDEHHGAAG